MKSLDVRRVPDGAEDVVIGSSPLMLLHALGLARRGRRVVVIEQEEVLGGAWYSPSRIGFERVEVGVHLIENRRSVYRTLESIGVELVVGDRGSFGVWRGVRFSLAFARAASFLGVLMRSVISGDRDAIATTFPRAARSLFSLFVPFRYPRGGAAQMVDTLTLRLEELGVVPVRGCRIEEVVLRPEARGGQCRTSLGMFEFEFFHFSSRAHCPIRIGNASLERVTKPRETLCLLLVIDKASVSDFAYVEILADPLLRRVRDVTDFVAPAPSREVRILCVQLRESGIMGSESSRDRLARVVRRLSDFGLVGRSGALLDTDVDRFVYQTLSDRELDSLASRHESLVCIKTTDFAEDMLRLVG